MSGCTPGPNDPDTSTAASCLIVGLCLMGPCTIRLFMLAVNRHMLKAHFPMAGQSRVSILANVSEEGAFEDRCLNPLPQWIQILG